MAVTLSSFLVRFPEFATGDTGAVQGALDSALDRTQGDMTLAEKDELVQLRTADFLARSPFARDLKLMLDDGSSVYSAPLKAVLLKVTIHRRYA